MMRRPAVICAILLGAISISSFGASVQVPVVPPLPDASRAPAPTGPVLPMPVTATAAPSAPATDDDTVTYDSGPSQYIDKDHRWLMTGGVLFQQGDAYLQTQSALVNLDSDMKAQDAKSLAPVHLWNKQDDLTGTHGTIDFTTHVATLRDHIMLIAKPDSKPSNSKESVRRQFKEPATITCDVIVYNYRKRTGHIPGEVTIRQKHRTVTADSADYDGFRKLVVLKGHVHAVQDDGMVVNAPEVQIGIEEGHEWLSIPTHVNGTIPGKKVKEEDDDGDSGQEQPAPPPFPVNPDDSGTAPATPPPGAAGTQPGTAPQSSSPAAQSTLPGGENSNTGSTPTAPGTQSSGSTAPASGSPPATH